MTEKPDYIDWVFSSENYRYGVTLYSGNFFGHCEVYKFSPSIARELKRKISEYISSMNHVYYMVVPVTDYKVNKFQKFLGFKFITENEGYNLWVS